MQFRGVNKLLGRQNCVGGCKKPGSEGNEARICGGYAENERGIQARFTAHKYNLNGSIHAVEGTQHTHKVFTNTPTYTTYSL